MQPALAIIETSSIAAGIVVGDAMVKRSPLDLMYAGTIHPGHYLVLVAGDVASVEEAVDEGVRIAGQDLLDEILLPDVHDDVVGSLRGERREPEGEALGVIETRTCASAVEAADAGVKGARVVLRDLRLGDGLGGKGYLLFGGPVAEVEAAVDSGIARVERSRLVAARVIAGLHGEMDVNLAAEPRFGRRVGG